MKRGGHASVDVGAGATSCFASHSGKVEGRSCSDCAPRDPVWPLISELLLPDTNLIKQEQSKATYMFVRYDFEDFELQLLCGSGSGIGSHLLHGHQAATMSLVGNPCRCWLTSCLVPSALR